MPTPYALTSLRAHLEQSNAPAATHDALAKWLTLLAEWNARIDLTAARNDEELVDLMIADAIVLSRAEHVPTAARVVDVGTGAGAPGLALALLRPDLRLTLVEPLTKRVSFLRTVLGTLGRSDVELVRERVEAFVPRREDGFDVAISRATLAPEKWVPVGMSLAPDTWALLAKDDAPTIANTQQIADVTYEWPLTRASRRAVRYRRNPSG